MTKTNKKSQDKPAQKQLEQLGRSIKSVLESDYISLKKLYWLNFSRGLFFGLGATIGGTLIVAIFIWILSQFTELPLIGRLVEAIENSLHSQ